MILFFFVLLFFVPVRVIGRAVVLGLVSCSCYCACSRPWSAFLFLVVFLFVVIVIVRVRVLCSRYCS